MHQIITCNYPVTLSLPTVGLCLCADFTEDETDLLGCVLLVRGAVDRVVEDVAGKAGPQRIRGSLLSLFRVCGAHHGSPLLNCIFLSQEKHHARPPETNKDRMLIYMEQTECWVLGKA